MFKWLKLLHSIIKSINRYKNYQVHKGILHELKVDSCTSVSVKTITCELKVDYCTSVSYKTITSELKVDSCTSVSVKTIT